MIVLPKSPNEAAAIFEPVSGLRSFEDIRNRIELAIEGNEAFSLVRCGDGEAATLGYPEYIHVTRYMTWMSNFFGGHATSPELFVGLRSDLENAIRASDVVGTFRDRVGNIIVARNSMMRIGSMVHLSQEQKKEISGLEWRILNNLIEPLISARQHLTSTNVHIRMEESGFLKWVIERSKVVNLITGNDIRGKLIDRFPSVKFSVFRVPTEYKFEANREGWNEAAAHYPDVYTRLRRSIIAGDFPGVTLVGAGPCGKVYCSDIKRAGGIALDIGSIMDLWAGRSTRSFMTRAKAVTFP